MKLTSKIIAPAVIIMMLGGVALSAALGLWQTESTKVPVRYRAGAFEGRYNPADIRGSYTFADIEAAFGVPVEVLARAFGMEGRANPGTVRASELEALFGPMDSGEIGTDSIRYFVSLYAGLFYVPEEDTLLPPAALSFLTERLTEAQLAEARQRLADFAAAEYPSDGAAGDALERAADHTEAEDDRTVKGKTTFGELLAWGLSQPEIEQSLGMEMGNRKTAVKDYLAERGISFGTARARLQALIDSRARP